MLEFPANDGIEVYASEVGLICFKSKGELTYLEPQVVCLTIGQFRSLLKNSDALIKHANENKQNYNEWLDRTEKDD